MMKSPVVGRFKSGFKSFKGSLLSFVLRSSPLSEKKTQRRSFPTPATATSDCNTPATRTPNTTTSTRRRRRFSHGLGKFNDLPPPPFVDTVGGPQDEIPQSHPLKQQIRGRRKQRILLKKKEVLYEWEQNTTHTTLRLPSNWALSHNNLHELTENNIKVLIGPSSLKVGITQHKKGGDRLEWKLHHTTGGTVNVEGSTWTTPEEHQMPCQGTIITLCKAKKEKWPCALLHYPNEEVQVILCRPPRTEHHFRHKQDATEKPMQTPVSKKKKKKKRVSAPARVIVNLKKKLQRESQHTVTTCDESLPSLSMHHETLVTPAVPPKKRKEKVSVSKQSQESANENQTPGRRSGEYSLKPSSFSRLNVYKQQENKTSTSTLRTSDSSQEVSQRQSEHEYSRKPTFHTRRNKQKEELDEVQHERRTNRPRSKFQHGSHITCPAASEEMIQNVLKGWTASNRMGSSQLQKVA